MVCCCSRIVSTNTIKRKNKEIRRKNYWLQLENAAIKKDGIISNDRCRNKTIAEAIEVLRDKYKLKDLLKYFNISKSTYMYWQKRLNRPNKDIEIEKKIQTMATEE